MEEKGQEVIQKNKKKDPAEAAQRNHGRRNPQREKRGLEVWIFILLAAFLFGTMETTCKLGGSTLDSYQLTFLRFVIGTICLAPFGIISCKKRGIKLNFKNHLWFMALGALCVPISMVCFQFGVEKSNASTMAVVFCTNPLFTMLIAHIFTSEKMNKLKSIAFALAVIGIVLMISPWDMQKGNSVQGFVYTIVAAVTFAIYTVISKKTIGKYGNFLQTFMSFFYGSIMLLVVMLIMHKPILDGVAGHIPLIIYIGAFITGAGYLCYFQGISLSNATTGSLTFLLKVAIAPVIAVIFLHENLLVTSIAGIILILGASILVFRENIKTVDITNEEKVEQKNQRCDEKKPKT